MSDSKKGKKELELERRQPKPLDRHVAFPSADTADGKWYGLVNPTKEYLLRCTRCREEVTFFFGTDRRRGACCRPETGLPIPHHDCPGCSHPETLVHLLRMLRTVLTFGKVPVLGHREIIRELP